MKFLSIITFALFISPSFALDIEKAISKKQIAITIESNGNGLQEGMLSLSTENLTNMPVSLTINCGQVFICQEDPRQNLILVKEELIALKPLQTKQTVLTVMCIEANDLSPGTSINYKLGSVAQGDLLSMAQYINKNSIFNFSGQEAIWVFSDNHEIGWIDPVNKKEADLRLFAANLLGIENPWYTTNHTASGNHQLSDNFIPTEPMEELYDMTSAEINGDFEWNLSQSSRITFGIYNEQGESIRTFFDNKPFSPGELSLRFHYRATHIPRGKYIARMTSGSDIIAQKEFSF